MASKPKKKVPSKFPRKPHAQAKGKRKKVVVPPKKSRGWMAAGFDISMSSMAGAAIAYDSTLKKLRGPAFVMRRWSKDDHYFSRLEMAVRAEELLQDLQAELGVFLALDEIYIAVEEPFPPGNFVRRGISSSLKQQAEINGAFLGGLLRYGYKEIFQIGNHLWRQLVAEDLSVALNQEISIHHTKWRDPALCERFNCKPADSGKFRSKQWALDVYPLEVPDWPDIISRDGVKIPRPENSKAKSMQPDDRYDALAIMEWMSREGMLALGLSAEV